MSKEKNLPLMNFFEISLPRRLSKGFVTCCGEGTTSSNTFSRDNHSFLLAEVSHGKKGKRERLLQASDAFSITHALVITYQPVTF